MCARSEGDDIAYGLVLDWLDWDHYAVLLVVPTLNRYALLRIHDGVAEDLLPWSAISGLTDGLNHISVARRGTTLDLSINGTVVAEAKQLAYFNELPTRTGLAVLAVGTTGTTGGFDNFLLLETLAEQTAAYSFVSSTTISSNRVTFPLFACSRASAIRC
jgi:hypothetical protein